MKKEDITPKNTYCNTLYRKNVKYTIYEAQKVQKLHFWQKNKMFK